MKRIFIIFFLFIGLPGCSKHYYRLDHDTLHLYLKASEAQSVEFASSLDKFRLHKAAKIDSSTWLISMPANREFKYFYTVDQTITIPSCPYKEKDDFGFENCIFLPEM